MTAARGSDKTVRPRRPVAWMDIYFIAVTVVYVAWRIVVFLKKIQ
jgi:hypothetical protein